MKTYIKVLLVFLTSANMLCSGDVFETLQNMGKESKLTITSITSDTADGTYGIGSAINVKVSFSDPVTLAGGGTLNVTLNTGAIVSISSINSSITADSTYAVRSGDNTSALNATDIYLLEGTLQDSTGKNAVIELPATNIGTDKTIVIDTIGPSITAISSATADGDYGVGAAIDVTVTFGDPVTLAGGGTLNVTLNTGDIVTISSINNSTTASGTYTVGNGDNTLALNATDVYLLGGTLLDSLNNDAVIELPATNIGTDKTIVIDTTGPSITAISSATADGSYGIGAGINVTVTFSDPVTLAGGGTLNVTLNTGDIVTISSINNSTTASGTYTVGSGDSTLALNATDVYLLGGTLLDSLNNDAVIELPATNIGTDKTIVIDTTGPSILSITSSTPDGSYGFGLTIDVTVTFSDTVTLSGGNLDITLNSGATLYIAPFTSLSTVNAAYIVGGGENSLDLDVTNIQLSVGASLLDVALNPASLNLPATTIADNSNIVVDTISPSVTNVTSTSSNGNYLAGNSIVIQAVFTENIIVTGTPQLTLETGTTDEVVNYASGSGSNTITFNYTVASGDVSPDLDYTGTNALALNGGTISDAAGNNALLTLAAPGAANSLGANKALVVDGVIPAVSNVTSSNSNGNYLAGNSIVIQAVFTENVIVTGTPQLTLETGTTDEVVNYASGSGSNTITFNYTVASGDVSPDLDYTGTNALALNGGTISDAAGNNALLTLAAPGAANSLGANKALVVDGIIPAVSNVTSSNSNGYYISGNNIVIQAVFTENVIVTGTPQLTLETGTTDEVVNYASGSGSNTLVFNYTVASGDVSPDLDYTGTNALALNGGTISDAAGNNALLTLAAPGAANSLGANKALVVDGVIPAVSNVTSSNSNGYYISGNNIVIQAVFTENVIVTGTPQLTLETGTTDEVVDYASGSGSNTLVFNYTVASGDVSPDLDYTGTNALALNGGTISDAAGNNALLTLAAPGAANSLGANKALVIDTTPPVIDQVTASNIDGTYGIGSVISVQVVFLEAVNITGTPQLTLETGTTDAVVNYASGSGTNTLIFNYTVASGQTSSDLDYYGTNSLSLNGGTIRDLAGNNAVLTLATPGAANSLGASKAIVIDGIIPAVTNVTSSTADGSYKSGDPISIQIVFSNSVTVTGTPQLTLETGTTDAVVNYSSGSGSNTLTFIYTIAGGQNSSDLNYTATDSLALNGGTIRKSGIDYNANNAALALPALLGPNSLSTNKAIIVDTTAPAVTNVTSSTSDATYGKDAVISIQIVFSENVTVTGTPQLTLETGASDAVVDYSSGSGTNTLTFNYTVASGHSSPDLDYTATNSLALNSGTIRDAATNDATLTLPAVGAQYSLGYNKALVIDGVLPTVTNITSSNPDGYYKSGNNIIIEVTFTKTVNVTGSPYLTLNTGGAGANAYYTAGDMTNTLSFSYAVTNGDIAFDLDYIDTSSLKLNSGTIKDNTGNDAVLTLFTPGTGVLGAGSLGINKNITIDTSSPVIINVTASNSNGTFGITDTISVQIVFNEIVNVAGTPQLTLETGATDAVVNYTSGGGTDTLVFDYTVANGHTSSDLDYLNANSLSLNSGTVRDDATNNAVLAMPAPGNPNSLSYNKAIVVDGIIPTVTNVTSSTANGSYKAVDIISIQVVFSHSVTVDTGGGTPTLTLETGTIDAVVDYTSGSGTNTLTFNYTIGAGENSSDLNYVATNSLALNSGTIVKTGTATNNAILTLPVTSGAGSLATNKALIVDTTGPVAANVTSSAANGTYGENAVIPIQVVFSEAVTVSGTPQLTLETGTADAVVDYTSGSGTNTLTFSYTVIYNELTNDLDYLDTGSLSLNGGSIADLAGNSATTTLPVPGAQYSLGYNKTIVINTNRPSVVSVSSSTGTGYYRDGNSISIQIVFSESVTVSGGTPQLTLETGTNDAVINYTSGSPSTTLTFTYTVSGADGHASSDLDYASFDSLSLNGATIDQTASPYNEANLTLPMPGSSGSLSYTYSIVIDTTSPIVSYVTSSKANGSYGTAELIPIQVVFSENVAVTGTPQITLETGTPDETVNYISGTGTGTLTFNYTVVAGDTSDDLDYVDTTSLALNTGTIKDLAGNDAVLTLASPGAANSLGANKAIVISTIPKTVQFTSTSAGNAENVTSINIPVELSVPSGSDVTVQYRVLGSSTATGGGIDYTLADGTATITAGLTSTNIPVTIVNDTKDENNETLVVELYNPGGASLGTNTTYTYTISDDDDPPTVGFALASSATVDESATAFNVTISLSAASGKTVTVSMTDSLTGTATSGSDYTITGGSPQSVSFSAGETSKTVTLTPVQDVADEGSGETVILVLSGPANATLGAIPTHTATITDDDGTPTISIVDKSISEGNSGSANTAVTVNLAGTSGSTVTVNYATSNGTADATDYSATSGTLTWTAGQTGAKTFNVSINGDTLAETNETVILTLSNPANATIADGSGILTITNDDTSLTVVSAQTLDCDPVDGYIDHYKITFSEAVTDSTFEGYAVNSEGSETTKWNIEGYTNVRLDHGTALNPFGGTDTANDNVIYLKFNPGSNVDTGYLPDLTATAATIQAAGGSGKINYNTGNVSATDGTRLDGAKPYIWYALATNIGGIDGHAGTDDTLQLRYSEPTNAPDLTGIDLDSIISINNGHDFNLPADIDSADWSSTNFTNDTLTITFAGNDATVDDGDTVKAQGSLVKDLSLNAPEDILRVLSPPVIAGTFDAGAVGPRVVSAEYIDTDHNGYIDHVKITYSKPVNDSTFPGYLDVNRVNSVQTVWKVSGYNNVALDTTTTINSEANTANDNVQYLIFSESSEYDTGAKPDLTASLAAAALKDNIDGCYINTSATDCLDSSKAVLRTTDVNEEDRAIPVIVIASARVGAPYIFVRFSENVWTTTDTPACGSGGQLVAADFSYNDVSAGGAAAVTNFDTDNCAETDAFVRILADANFVTGDIYSDQIGAASDQIYDAADNAMSGSLKTTIVPTVAPYLVNASSYYNNATGKYYFRIVFSEPMDYASATTAANYTLSEDTATSCSDIGSIPRSISPLSSTVFDLETIAQCGTGDTYPTVYRITASANVMDINLSSPLGTPNAATTMGTSSTDQTRPRLIQALSTSSTTVRLTFSEPMKTGDDTGSAECMASYGPGGGVTCDEDIDATAGTQQIYRITPTLGTISSVVATSDPSVFILTHTDNQIGSFYTITAYADNSVDGIPEDKYGSPSNNIAPIPDNQTTFKGSGQAINNFNSGTLFDDPFADNTDFSFAFNYRDRIYLGPNDINSGAFRFEADALNPVTVTFNAIGTSCPGGTSTFGYGSNPLTCNVDMGPYGESGIVGFNSGTVSIGGTDYEILMVGPINQNGALYSYYTQDIDTQLNWGSCYFSPTGGGNTKSIQTTYAFDNSYYIGYSSSHGIQAPILVRWQLTASGGILSCSTASDLTIRSLPWLGKNGSPANPAKAANSAAVVGIDSVIYIPSTGSPSPSGTFYIANNGGVAAAAYTEATDTIGSFTTFLTQTNLLGVTLVLPYAPVGLEKIRPGQRGVPKFVVYNNALYMARNLAVAQTSADQVVNNGAELWKCTANCTTNTNWHKVALSSDFDYLDSSGSTQDGSRNTAIGFMQVNGNALYIGFDNPTDGVTLWRATTEIDPDNTGDGYNDFTQQSTAGVGLDLPYIFSSASLSKQGVNYIYVTIGDGSWAIKVVRQRD